MSIRTTIIAAALVVSAGTAHAETRGNFGLGLQVGGPTGITGKYYMPGSVALQFGLGIVESAWDDGTHIYGDVLWHPKVLTRQPAFVMPFYLGVGGRLLEDDNDHFFHCHRDICHGGTDDDLHVGVRVPFGLLMDFRRIPLDVFLELTPVIDFIHDDYDDDTFCFDGHCHADFDDDDLLSLYGTIGARYYF